MDTIILEVLVPVHLTGFQRTSKLVRFNISPINMIAVITASFYFDTNSINMISKVLINSKASIN